jgi:undecaprenyl-diphosphatase
MIVVRMMVPYVELELTLNIQIIAYASHDILFTMEMTHAIILGLVQGVTEFLPVSSTGHLVLVHEWLSVEGANALAFDAVLHFATTAAVIVYFWSDLWVLLQAGLRKLGRLPVNKKDITMLYSLMIGTIPAVAIGLLFEGIVSEYLRTPLFVAGALFAASIFFLYAEWKYYLQPSRGEITLKMGIMVGLFQALALLPGMSRSGSTIAGGMLLGLSRYEATRFSFLLAIPITLGVGIKMSMDLLKDGGLVDWVNVGVGSAVAFFTALLVIHFFLRFIRKYTLWPFVWYGIILAAMIAYVNIFT